MNLDAGSAHYRRALDAALREYEKLLQDRDDLDKRIAQLSQTVGTLSRLCGAVPTVTMGPAEACRIVLKGAGHPLTVTEIRAQLEAMGFDLSRYLNGAAVIHTSLKRLSEHDEVDLVPHGWGKPAYVWKPKAPKRGSKGQAR